MWKVCTILILCICIESEAVFAFVPQSQSTGLNTLRDPRRSTTKSSERFTGQLFAEGGKKKSKGVYVRPSGAIEKGSGFFVPGLEGPKVRVAFGSVLLLFTVVNHITSPSSIASISFEEIIAIFYSILILFQAAIEFGKEELIVEGGASSSLSKRSSSSSDEDLVQNWATLEVGEGDKSKIQWAATSFLSITPATQIMLLEKSASSGNQMVYRLGSTRSTSSTFVKDESAGVAAALEQLQQSKGGRISLPLTHPAAVALGLSRGSTSSDETGESAMRCIVLQRITDDSCWLVTSDQLLASFTQADLKWLGRLAAYVAQPAC